MIKYETINGTLCRMVEPEPLTETATFPCVVRLIQDDSPMGRYNLKLRNIALEPLVVTGIAKDIGVVTHLVPRPHFSCECYEIIGYPVADGSAEWALYHVLHKERRALTGYVNDVLVHIQNTEYGIGLYYSGKIMPFDFITPEQFIEGAAHTGWQPYEPEPEPKFAVGDWVEHRESKEQARIVHIASVEYDGITIKFSYSNETEIYSTREFNIEFRKLSPSEVIVNIGCLKGTVTYAVSNDCFLLAKVYDPQHRACCIDMSMLNTATRELVESLLKAQEGK